MLWQIKDVCTFTVVSNQPATELLSNVAVYHNILTCRNNNALPGLEHSRSSRCVCDAERRFICRRTGVFNLKGTTCFFREPQKSIEGVKRSSN